MLTLILRSQDMKHVWNGWMKPAMHQKVEHVFLKLNECKQSRFLVCKIQKWITNKAMSWSAKELVFYRPENWFVYIHSTLGACSTFWCIAGIDLLQYKKFSCPEILMKFAN